MLDYNHIIELLSHMGKIPKLISEKVTVDGLRAYIDACIGKTWGTVINPFEVESLASMNTKLTDNILNHIVALRGTHSYTNTHAAETLAWRSAYISGDLDLPLIDPFSMMGLYTEYDSVITKPGSFSCSGSTGKATFRYDGWGSFYYNGYQYGKKYLSDGQLSTDGVGEYQSIDSYQPKNIDCFNRLPKVLDTAAYNTSHSENVYPERIYYKIPVYIKGILKPGEKFIHDANVWKNNYFPGITDENVLIIFDESCSGTRTGLYPADYAKFVLETKERSELYNPFEYEKYFFFYYMKALDYVLGKDVDTYYTTENWSRYAVLYPRFAPVFSDTALSVYTNAVNAVDAVTGDNLDSEKTAAKAILDSVYAKYKALMVSLKIDTAKSIYEVYNTIISDSSLKSQINSMKTDLDITVYASSTSINMNLYECFKFSVMFIQALAFNYNVVAGAGLAINDILTTQAGYLPFKIGEELAYYAVGNAAYVSSDPVALHSELYDFLDTTRTIMDYEKYAESSVLK